MEDTCSGSSCDFTKTASKDKSDTCKLIIIGLEGVGKTTLVNEACGTKFDTSDGRDGCNVKDDQKGSFKVDGFSRHYELIDMLGVNYKNPGEWQRTLHGRSHVHGVIFYISGANPRDSALGELPRIGEYCSNLKIPVLHIYRDGLLRFKPFVRINSEISEIETEVDGTTEKMSKPQFKRYTNLDEVKRIIAQTFETAETLHPLLDPIIICAQVQKLREDNQQLDATIKTLKQKREDESILHKKELGEQMKKYDEQVFCLNQSLDEATKSIQSLQGTLDNALLKHQESLTKLGNDIQVSINENQRLRLSLDALQAAKVDLEGKYSQLDEDKRKLDFLFHDTSQKYDQLLTARNELEVDIAALAQQKRTLETQKRALQERRDYLEKCINETGTYLENKLEHVVNVVHTTECGRQRVKPKKFDGGGKWMWLPGRAYEVIGKYDDFAKQVKTVVASLRYTFQKMNNQETSNESNDDDNN